MAAHRISCSLIIPLVLSLSYTGGARLPFLSPAIETDRVPLNADLRFAKFVGRYDMDVENHVVETADGYLLRVFRVRKKGCQFRGVPVVLYHGLQQDAFSWAAAGAESPAALIASTCADIWLPNARGTRYSRAHSTLSPSERAFWQFSVDELGRYDLPAVVDHVLGHTGHARLNYIGFSQGAGTFFVMCSELPHYCHKVGVMIALAPATRHLNTKSVIFRLTTDLYRVIEPGLTAAGIYEALAHGGLFQEIVSNFCPISNETLKICDKVKDYLASSAAWHSGSVTAKTFKVIAATVTAGTSVHNMARYGQSLHTKYFRKFDYGAVQNMRLYGSVKPPVYNFTAVTVPVVVVYGANDGVTDIQDVEWSTAQLPNVLEAVKVNNCLWNHLDMIYSKYFKDLVFPKIEEYLGKFGSLV